ncbi:MAG: hypothetical protein KDK27_02270 [Leptospiraceae bacterium]|nr:hypothetical protein [Leptospiraceae bacterium]
MSDRIQLKDHRLSELRRITIPPILLLIAGFLAIALPNGARAGEEIQPMAAKGPVYEWNFSHENSEYFLTFQEIETRARNRNLIAIPDSPGRNILDYEAGIIPQNGLEFELDVPGQSRAFLYLDLVSYRPLTTTSGNQTEGKVHWLEVWANNQRLALIYQGGGQNIESPVILTLEREMSQNRKVVVRLRPSPGDSTFAIWDAYISRYREEVLEPQWEFSRPDF